MGGGFAMQLDEKLSYPGGHRVPWEASVKALRHSESERESTRARDRERAAGPTRLLRAVYRYQMSSGHRFALGGPICSIARDTAQARAYSVVRARGHQVGCCLVSPYLKKPRNHSAVPAALSVFAVCKAGGGPPVNGSRERPAQSAGCSVVQLM